MTHIRLMILTVTIALVAACNYRNEPAIEDEDLEGKHAVVIHESIDHTVKYVKHAVGYTDDGRMRIQVVLSSKAGKDRALILTTQWFDGGSAVVEQSTPRPMVIPTGGTLVFEDTAFTTEAVYFNVQVRPAETSRKG
jgi:hypothetical protein